MSARVLIVGAGPAGLAAAARLAGSGREVTVLEREREAGGVPRHCAHQGFGLRDLRRSLDGPRYADRRVELAKAAGAQIRTAVQVIGWADERTLAVASSHGPEHLEADAVLLATGCRERSRPARLIPGDRCAGVMNTGTLQRLVAAGQPVGRRALVVGAEHVSYSALATLRHAGVETAGMVSEMQRPQTFAAFQLGAAVGFGIRASCGLRLAGIEGGPRVRAVWLTDANGESLRVDCDTVVLTADWIPERELAVAAGLAIDPGTGGPACDALGRSSRAGVFVAGNLLHGAETADRAACEGDRAARALAGYLANGRWPERRLGVRVRTPLRWAAPSLLAGDAHGELSLRAEAQLTLALLTVRQDGRTLAQHRLLRVAPGRRSALPRGWDEAIDFDGGPVTLALAAARTGRRRSTRRAASALR